MRCGSPGCLSCDKRKIDVLRLFEPILQSSAWRLGNGNSRFERLPSIQKLLTLPLVAPADKAIAAATCNFVCMDVRW